MNEKKTVMGVKNLRDEPTKLVSIAGSFTLQPNEHIQTEMDYETFMEMYPRRNSAEVQVVVRVQLENTNGKFGDNDFFQFRYE